ncbi:MAG: hypothetical protein LBQ66_16980, partial [Planctomycetaceae bacterium]|nr:hypothetical protein [Planctomycetaceae bacterium]
MSKIEQAVVHIRIVNKHGRKVESITATDGVREIDKDEFIAWFSEGDDTTIIQYDQSNIFFHPLPSGDFAIGIINPSEGRSGKIAGYTYSFLSPPKSFFVRVLILSPTALFQQANNPIALYERLLSHQKIPPIERQPRRLRTITVPPSRSFCDTRLLRRIEAESGIVAMTRLFQSLFDSVCTIFRSGKLLPTQFVINGLLNFLPIRFRSSLTFSTELFLSSSLPIQAIGFQGTRKRADQLSESSGIPLVDFERFDCCRKPPENIQLNAWQQFVMNILRDKDFAYLEYQIKTDAEYYDEPIDFADWHDLNDLAIHWQRKPIQVPIKITPQNKTNESAEKAEKELEQSIAAVELLMDDMKRKPV